jgi:hypothetical protein
MIRQYDTTKDSREQLLDIWNQSYGTKLFTLEHFERINPENVLVICEGEEVVGFAFLLDGGMPYAMLDQLHLRPRYRRFTTYRDVYMYAESLCAARGIKWLYAVMDGSGGDAEQTVDLLKRRGHWKAQYLGEKPMLVKSLT